MWRGFMALQQKLGYHMLDNAAYYFSQSRHYSKKVDWKKLRPMIHKRIGKRARDYPVEAMVPVAYEVIKARALLIDGITTLLKSIPIKACKFCPEIFIGEKGHLIKTCRGFRRHAKNQVHEWTTGGLNDILVPVETFHLRKMFQDIIKHDQRFDFDRIPAVLELCCQAGVNIFDESLQSMIWKSNISEGSTATATNPQLFVDDLITIANGTLDAWERLRSGVQRLLLVYPGKVCKHCSEVHIGPSGHKARLCGVFKHESWRGTHLWKKAELDDLVPPKVVWRRRCQDPPLLFDEGRDFYGHAPAVVELCAQAGAVVPTKYFCMMKFNGLGPPASLLPNISFS
ncbi:hypothetical protein Scep_013937 [Stephania cephalantha]|uniref:APO domain-containing protein n=1 Tax=Stephania cephalantha TaxID=152367 RepID=A0AAP0J0A7_9MAGN